MLSSKNPHAKMISPAVTQVRDPKRLISQPWTGPRKPLSSRDMEKAPEINVRLQPNSAWRKTKYAPKAWKKRPPLNPWMTNAAATIHQP